MNAKNPESYLIDQGFVLRDTLEHDKLTDFIIPWYKKRNFYTILFRIVNFALLVTLGAIIGFQFADGTFSMTSIWYLLAGVVSVLLLVPLHEYIHGLAYKMAGAKDVRYKVLWRELIFYAMAEKFIADYKAFRLVALAPFLIINCFLLILMFSIGSQWFIFFLGALIIHTLCCVGDFSLLSYMYEQRKRDVRTYDDIENGKSYFYVKDAGS